MSRGNPSYRRLIDPAVVRARRFELGVAERVLGDALGVEPGVIRRLERGHSQDQLTVSFVVDLAEALMLPIHHLLEQEDRPPEPPRDDDAATVGAVLARIGEHTHVDVLADKLGWTVDRTDAALDALEGRLHAVGQTLGWTGDSLVRIADLYNDETVRAAEAVTAGRVATDGLTLADAKLLWAVALQNTRKTKANTLPVLNLRKLVAAGLVTVEPEGPWDLSTRVRLTEAGDLALRWDTPPPTEVKQAKKRKSST